MSLFFIVLMGFWMLSLTACSEHCWLPKYVCEMFSFLFLRDWKTTISFVCVWCIADEQRKQRSTVTKIDGMKIFLLFGWKNEKKTR